MIANPTKEIIIQFSIDDVKSCLKKIANYMSGCKMTDSDDILNQYQYQFSEFLSLGAVMTVNLTEVDGKTKINLESSRVTGAYDQSYEVNNAKQQMDKFLKSLSHLLQNPNIEISEVKKVTEKNEWYNSNSILILLVIVFWPAAIYQLILRYNNKK